MTTSSRPRLLHRLALFAVLLPGAGAPVTAGILDEVPDIGAVTDYRPKIPLRVYSADRVLIGEFGTERRDFVPIAKIPSQMKAAVLSIEDARFYEHGGIDWIRALGAAKANLASLGGGYRQGGSTITMQVARNFFLSRDKTLPRKLTEAALAYKIEQALTKDQILEVYMNQIYLGQRSYGFSSAARTYFGKPLEALTLAETAMLAGLPQNPSRHNPVANPERAQQRQHTVLRRMFELKHITEAQYRRALAEPLKVRQDGGGPGAGAEYVAELARQAAFTRFGQAAYERGYSVITTINAAEQSAAYEAVRRNAIAYDKRHGYRGPEARIKLPAQTAGREEAIATALQGRPAIAGFAPAVVLAASPKRVRVATRDGDTIEITGAGLGFAAPALSATAKAGLRLAPGAVVRISSAGKGTWSISQVPQVASAFVALDAQTGAYRALVGGFDYQLQKLNHVTQAWRQPGSSIKPFVYSAGLEQGFFPGTAILDEPLDFSDDKAYANWAPRNDDGLYQGVVTVRHALTHSRNVATVRMLRSLDMSDTRSHLARFGFDMARHPSNLTLALGTGAVTPLQLAGAYAVIANGGYRVEPLLITTIQDRDGKVLFEAPRPRPRQDSARLLDARNAFLADSMLRDVARVGTGAQASRQLQRSDLAGKTGTTSNAIDGWFAGYGGNVVAVAWMGYDEPRSLGSREFGSTLALPVWIDYMRVALAKVPERAPVAPEGVVRAGDDWIYAEFAGQEPQPLADPAAGVAPVADPSM
ncbi:penicillin-binding protein 1A [Telluria aromaticivorans]|uniref:Penicillin-binding protein 1A n=1 Tax=Telluria aromaticivorans TaxID=2725995 RepID=A0A7Y2JWU8_9BURK|nr:PBP1A family penicillin-binding protein [Telluria aromaticivorans]NNG22477.1 PBP1A family penicillin-binding protein [Telluria aromaticivorans]